MIDAHRGAFEYDWRTRFHKPLRAVGRSMSWGEAIRLTERLATDPSSHVAASLAEWAHPIAREALVLADTFDLTHQIAWSKGGRKGSKPKPYPRPWPDKVTKRFAPSVSQDQVLAMLRSVGHNEPVPVRR